MPLLESLLNLDISIFLFINKSLSNPIFDFLFRYMFYSAYILEFFFILVIIYFFLKKEKALALLLIFTLVVNLFVASILKSDFERERPYQILEAKKLINAEDNSSFPSRHAELAFAFSTIMIFFYRRFGLLLILISAIIGIGRIYVGIHYPSDVVGGALIGILLSIFILKLNIVKMKALKKR